MIKRIILSFAYQLLFISLICNGCSLQGRDYSFSGSEDNEILSEQDARAASLIKKFAHPVSANSRDYEPLMKMIGDARFVLLGESTHGTHEFYRERGG